MLAIPSTIRSTVYVSVALALALTIAGFASSAYSNERSTLGHRHFQSGEWSLEHGDLSGAIDQLRKALLFSPDDEEYRLTLAETLVRDNHLDEAEAHLEQLAEEDPSNGRVNYLLAQIAEKRGRTKDAIERLQRAVYEYWPPNMIPERRAARWNLVQLLQRNNRNSEAIGELIQLNASAPNAEERTRIAFDLLGYGALSEAERMFRELETGAPNEAAPRRGLGMVDFDMGEFVAARHEFQAARRFDPKDQQSEQWLSLTNEVIDLDPLLPGIRSFERLRRSQNLLRSVVKAVENCSPGIASNEEAGSELAVANELLANKRKIEGVAEVMQQSAAQLWRDRHLFCRTGLASEDKAIDIAIAKVAGE